MEFKRPEVPLFPVLGRFNGVQEHYGERMNWNGLSKGDSISLRIRLEVGGQEAD